MARTKDGERNRRLIGLIAKYKAMFNATDGQVADEMGISRQFYSKRYKEKPLDLGMDKLMKLKDRYEIPAEELAEVFR